LSRAHARNGIRDDRARTIVPGEQRRHRNLAAQQAMRHLDEQTGAIATLAVGVEAAAMGEAGESEGAKRDRFMAELGGGDKAHSTGSPGRGEVPRPGKA